MQAIQKRCRQLLGCSWAPYGALFVVMAAFFLLVQYRPGDEIYYGGVMEDLADWPSLIKMLENDYQTWSARMLIETLFCVFSTLPVLAWRLVTPALVTAAAWMLAYALQQEKRADTGWLVCMLVYLYQWSYLADTGWIVTSIAYGWSTAFSLLGMYCLFAVLRGARPRPWQWLLCTLSLAVGANMEQSALLLAFLYGGCLLWLWCDHKRFSVGLLLQWALVIGLLVFALTAPGNACRAQEDVFKFYLNYPMVQFWEKVESGISGAIDANVYGHDFVFYLFALLSALAVWEKKGTPLARWLAVLPAVLLLPLSVFRYDVKKFFPQIHLLTESYQGAHYITQANFGQPLAYLPMLLGYGILALCVLNLLAAFGFGKKTLLLLGLLAVGGMSQAALAFTPSIAVSSRRTGIFFTFCIIAVCGLVWRMLGHPALRRKGCKIVFFLLSAMLCGIQAISLIEMC